MAKRKTTAKQIAFSSGLTVDQLFKQDVPLSRFERLCKKLTINPTDTQAQLDSIEIQLFVKQNLNTYYVPTALLSAMRLQTQFDSVEQAPYSVIAA